MGAINSTSAILEYTHGQTYIQTNIGMHVAWTNLLQLHYHVGLSIVNWIMGRHTISWVDNDDFNVATPARDWLTAPVSPGRQVGWSGTGAEPHMNGCMYELAKLFYICKFVSAPCRSQPLVSSQQKKIKCFQILQYSFHFAAILFMLRHYMLHKLSECISVDIRVVQKYLAELCGSHLIFTGKFQNEFFFSLFLYHPNAVYLEELSVEFLTLNVYKHSCAFEVAAGCCWYCHCILRWWRWCF